jgi:hypothetical protein
MVGSEQTLSLNIVATDADPSDLQKVTRELAATLNRQPGIDASLAEGASEPGAKGDPITLGAILLQLASGGGVFVTLIGVLKNWMERDPAISVEFEMQRQDGAKLKIRADRVKPDSIEQLREEFENFASGKPWQNSATQS